MLSVYNIKYNLKYIRDKKGIDKKELADNLGVTERTITNYENGSSLPPTEKLDELAKLTKSTLEELLRG